MQNALPRRDANNSMVRVLGTVFESFLILEELVSKYLISN